MTVPFLSGALLAMAVPCLAAAAALAVRGVRAVLGGDPTSAGRDLWLVAWLAAVVSLVVPHAADVATWHVDRPAFLYLPLFNPFLLGAAAVGYVTALTRPPDLRRSAWLLAPATLAFALGLWAWARSVWGGADPQSVTAAVRISLHIAVAFNVGCVAIAARTALAASDRASDAPTSEVDLGRWAARFAAVAVVTTAVWAATWAAAVLGGGLSTRALWWPHVAVLALAYPIGWAGFGAHRTPDATGAVGPRPDTGGVVGQLRGSAFLSLPLLTIGAIFVWLVAYGSSCTGFNCLGIGALILVGLAVTALQVLVFVPAVWYRRARAGRPFGAAAAVWVGASVATLLLAIAVLRAIS